ncbi:hypothetical protein GMRT_11518 [Giardia muris]|uniref:B box-type domain-containing protein n=1 Tax=Giardia muris TaxID=5742 RepID=A0A4Z1SQU7_GIAMU|nr:hypothetical protein GMRT_11518 [Giardia muris]|eukprot:TNJ27315.1 hypothetical protein GMRT_11518 [Giardia muris]
MESKDKSRSHKHRSGSSRKQRSRGEGGSRKREASEPVPSQVTMTPTQPVDPCENCGTASATEGVYCLSCRVILCDSCDRTLHTQIALQEHERVSAWEAGLYRQQCGIHGQRADRFCTSCNTVLCQACIDMHSGAPHTILPLKEAFTHVMGRLSALTYGPLTTLKQTVKHEISRVQGLQTMISETALKIERRIRMKYEGTLARLNRAAGLKTALCQHDVDSLRNIAMGIEKMEAILARADRPLHGLCLSARVTPAVLGPRTNERLTPVQVLISAPQLLAQAESLLALNLADLLSVTEENLQIHDLPQEVDTDSGHDNTEVHVPSNSVRPTPMDPTVVPLYQHEEEITRIRQDAEAELFRWRSLVEGYAHELQAWDMVCQFCGQPCTPEAVNRACEIQDKHIFVPRK